MLQIKSPTADVGVIVGRFQVPDLHKAHLDIIETVMSRHSKVIIMLGISPICDAKDPLDFETRRHMINAAFPDILVGFIPDNRYNDQWSKNLDTAIRNMVGPKQSVILYGGRDSFISAYSGKYKTLELVQEQWISGSEIRSMVKNTVGRSRDFRHGAIWESWQRFDTVYTTVDIAVLNTHKQIMLGQKAEENKWRLIGGFSDPSDVSFEASAERELREEVPGIEFESITPANYIGSFNIKDWRYRGKSDCIRTLLYCTKYTFGTLTAGDDIEEVKWFDIKDLRKEKIEEIVQPEHIVLVQAVLGKIKNK